MPKAKTLLYPVEDGRSAPASDDTADRIAGRRGQRGASKDAVLFASAPPACDRPRYVVCCVDDTDDLTGDTSTGYLAERIADGVAAIGGQVVLGITRHQLLLAEGVPYTSHNSAMCFAALLPTGGADGLRKRAVEVVARHRAAASDPGLCIADLPARQLDERLRREIRRLGAFGRKAKAELCTKEEAYALAQATPWLTLSEHGGTGDGVIGALAGVGLRLGGSDGRFRGRWNLAALLAGAGGEPGRGAMPVGEFCAALQGMAAGPVQVLDVSGRPVDAEVPVVLDAEAKPILRDGALTVVARVCDGEALPCKKVDLGGIGNDGTWNRYCDFFQFDNDAEECLAQRGKSCRNCLYRRWTPRGFDCVARGS